MFTTLEPPRLEIPTSTVEKLIQSQFPQWAHLSIQPVEKSGWDNRTFHLGEEMSVRLPSAERYTHQVKKEQQWLPILAPQLSTSISQPIALGHPSEHYPWHWSVYKWIEGDSADQLQQSELDSFAKDLAEFLKELQNLDATAGPKPGPFYRGASVSHYDDQTQKAISALSGVIDDKGATATWKEALKSEWESPPVWVHGDLSSDNILVREGQLAAVIDFGSCCVGDPACDLVITWTFLSNSARNVFKSHLSMDHSTWSRARGWALWKALISLADLNDPFGPEANRYKSIINLVIEENREISCQ